MTQDFQTPAEHFAEWMRTADYSHEFPILPPARRMYDATGQNAPGLVRFSPVMVAGYDTGTPDVKWPPPEWLLFPHAVHVHIDQAGPGAPSRTAHVMDVQPGAYRPPDVPAWVAQSHAPRPTVYCDRNDLPAVQAFFHGPVWLAWPGWNGEPLPRGNEIVAVQNVVTATYDTSVVFDPTWPGKTLPPPNVREMIHGILDPSLRVQDFVPFPQGTFSRVYLYHDFTSVTDEPVVRVAAHSVSGGYAISDHTVTHSVPEVVDFTASDVDAVSLVIQGDVPVGWTLALWSPSGPGRQPGSTRATTSYSAVAHGSACVSPARCAGTPRRTRQCWRHCLRPSHRPRARPRRRRRDDNHTDSVYAYDPAPAAPVVFVSAYAAVPVLYETYGVTPAPYGGVMAKKNGLQVTIRVPVMSLVRLFLAVAAILTLFVIIVLHSH